MWGLGTLANPAGRVRPPQGIVGCRVATGLGECRHLEGPSPDGPRLVAPLFGATNPARLSIIAVEEGIFPGHHPADQGLDRGRQFQSGGFPDETATAEQVVVIEGVSSLVTTDEHFGNSRLICRQAAYFVKHEIPEILLHGRGFTDQG